MTVRPSHRVLPAVGLIVSGLVVGLLVAADPAGAVAAPTVRSVSPTSGKTVGGTRVTVTGTGFTHVRAVKFGTSSGTSVSVLSSTKLAVTAPAHAAGLVGIRVTTAYGTSAAVSADHYTYVAPPAVTAVSPTSGKTAAGTRVTITGARFIHVTAVKFGTTSGTSISVLSSTKLAVTAPAHAAGLIGVHVITRYGTSPSVTADHYTYVAPPVISSIAPTSGTTAGGTRVTVTGTNFLHVTAVTFAGVAGTSLSVASSTKLAITAPPHTAGLVTVQVKTTYGASASVTADQYTYVLTPAVSALSTDSGSVVGAETVTITGANLSGATAVYFGASAAADFTVLSSTEIQVTTPAALPSTVDVRVSTPAGTSPTVAADLYSFVNPPDTSEASFTPAAATQSNSLSEVLSVTGGDASATGGLQTTPWLVTLSADAPVPSVGESYYLPSGDPVFPTGLAGTVTAAADGDNGAHIVTVTATSVDTVLDQVGVNFTGSIGDNSSSTSSGQTSTTVVPDAASLTGTVNFGKISASALKCGNADGLSVDVNGSLTLKLEYVKAHVEVNLGSWFSTPFVDVWVQYEPTIGFNLTAEGVAECSLSATWQNEHKKLFVLSDTGATLAIAPDVTFSITASGTITVQQHSYRMLGFFSNPDGSISKIDAKSSDPTNVVASGKLEADAYAGVQIQVGELDVIGVGMSLGGGMKATAEVDTNPSQVCASLTPYLRGSLYAYLNLWIKEWKLQAFQVELDLDLLKACVPLSDIPPPNPPPSGIAFDGSPGTGAPPSTLGPYTMTPFGEDPQPTGAVSDVIAPTGATIGFGDTPLDHELVGQGWATWSNGYTGDVYSTSTDGQTAVITLPAGTRGFYFYAEPDPYEIFDVTATTTDGTSSGPIQVDGYYGARYFGFYTDGSAPLDTITITSPTNFAIGEFGISTGGG